jgi:uncharacterized protein (TIGR03067 family)
MFVSWLVVASVLGLTSWSQAQTTPARDDRQFIQGTWTGSAGWRDGELLPADAIAGVRLTFSGDELTALTPGGESSFPYKLDPGQSPKAIDVDMDGQAGLGIYTLEGDTLTICHGELGEDRPEEFDKAPGSGLTILVLRRADPNGRAAIEDLVARVQRADYEGDRSALARLHDELKPFVDDEKLGALAGYWRGFAVWRRAINGFNETVDRVEQERDLSQAVADFEAALANQPDFVDAKIGAVGASGLFLFANQKSPADGGGFASPEAAQAIIAKLTPWMKDLQTSAADNPRYQWIMGPILLARGGGPDKAIEMYRKGLDTIRKSKRPTDPLVPAWGEPELLMNLAWTYLNKPEPDLAAAEENARAALQLVPHWHYVKDILLPQIEAAKSKAKETEDGDQAASTDRELARDYFQDAARLCQLDGGKLWGVSLAGPMMFVDPKSRLVFANQADADGLLKPDGPVFVGQLPESIPIANYSLAWAGERWTMVMWPLPSEVDRRRVLLMHESWHRIQADLGLPMTGPDNGHLDTLHGRYWLQLEWRALRQALAAGGEEGQGAIQDALQCRRHRRVLCPNSADSERELETHEGMAEYSGIVLSGLSAEQQRQYAIKHLDEKPTQFPSFTRSFAYVSGPAYGLLLDQVQPGWNRSAKPETDLGESLRKVLGLELPELTSLELFALTERYDHDGLLAREKDREEKRTAREKELRARFVDGPVLVLPLEKPQISFNPAELVPIAGAGTYFNTARVSDAWGLLQVSDGMLKSSDGRRIHIAPPTEPGASPLRGLGWELTLATGWQLAPGDRSGSFELRQKDAN